MDGAFHQGTGKTHLYRHVTDLLTTLGVGFRSGAAIGAAAVNMGGNAATLHSLFAFPREDAASKKQREQGLRPPKAANKAPHKLDPLMGEALAAGRASFADVHFLIIDEISTVSCQFLSFIDERYVHNNCRVSQCHPRGT